MLEEVKIEENEFIPNRSDKDNFFEKICIKPISSEEAIKIFSESIHSKVQPRFYFWDDERDKCNGNFFDMVGYNFESDKYVVWNFVGSPIYKEHCGTYRILDSDYLLPVNYDGTIKWIKASTYAKHLYEGMSKEKLKPVYKTSLNEKYFYERVSEEIERLKRIYG